MSPGFLFLHVSDRVTAGRNLCFLQSPVSVPFFSSSATRICSFVSSVSKRLLACLSFSGSMLNSLTWSLPFESPLCLLCQLLFQKCLLSKPLVPLRSLPVPKRTL